MRAVSGGLCVCVCVPRAHPGTQECTIHHMALFQGVDGGPRLRYHRPAHGARSKAAIAPLTVFSATHSGRDQVRRNERQSRYGDRSEISERDPIRPCTTRCNWFASQLTRVTRIQREGGRAGRKGPPCGSENGRLRTSIGCRCTRRWAARSARCTSPMDRR